MLFLTSLDYAAEDFRRIRTPTLILSGDRDEFIPVEEQVEIYRLAPTAELAIVPNVGHGFPDSQVEAFNEVVAAFFRRHAAQADPAADLS